MLDAAGLTRGFVDRNRLVYSLKTIRHVIDLKVCFLSYSIAGNSFFLLPSHITTVP